MYDSEYFKKVIGDNYSKEKVYTTYKNDYENNILPVNAEVKNNEDKILNDTAVAEITPKNTVSEVGLRDTTSEAVLNERMESVSSNVNNINPQAISYNNSLYPEDYYSSINLQNNNNYNDYQEVQNTSNEYPEIYNVVNPMIEDLLSKNQDMVYTSNVIDSMAMEVYNALEVDNNPIDTTRNVNSNGIYSSENIVNVNARPKNRLLHDLIKIILLHHINRPHPDRPTPRPPYPPRPRY